MPNDMTNNPPNSVPSAVRDNPQQSRFEMATESGLALADYRLNGDVMTIYHTEVPVALRGRGKGVRLVAGALEIARAKGYKIIPSCWFVRDVMASRRAYDDMWAR